MSADSERPGREPDPIAERAEGGEPACWVHLVCDECGAMTSDGHRAGCARALERRDASVAPDEP